MLLFPLRKSLVVNLSSCAKNACKVPIHSILFLNENVVFLLEKILLPAASFAQDEFYVLVEVSGSNENHDKEKLERLLQEASEAEVISDGIFCQVLIIAAL